MDGPMFDQDYKKAMRLIKDLTIDTPSEACIKQVEN